MLISSFGGCSDGNSTKNVNTSTTSTLGKTGQIISYTNFDDGYYKKGVEKVYIRDDKNGVITDNLSTLMWQDDVKPTTLGVYWYEARKYYTNEKNLSYTLPRRSEKNIYAQGYISSTTTFSSSYNIWFIGFNKGVQYTNSKAYDSGYIRCVR